MDPEIVFKTAVSASTALLSAREAAEEGAGTCSPSALQLAGEICGTGIPSIGG